MDKIDIIIPVKNEEKNIEELVERIHSAMSQSEIAYSIIFVDDHSSDATVPVIENLAKSFPITVKTKEGKPGKAYSILEGAKLSQAKMVAMIDGDLQYPPEAIPEMVKLAHLSGIAVANRKIYHTTLLRRVASKVNRFVFGRLLFGLQCDVQSGLKVMRKEVLDQINPKDVTPWTIDLHILYTASELGFRPANVDIYFKERKHGQSKIKFFNTALEIGVNAFKLKIEGRKLYQLRPYREDTLYGAGLAHKRRRFITHTTLPHEQSAYYTLKGWQKALMFGAIGLLILGLLVSPKPTAIAIIAFLSFLYFADVIFSLVLLVKSLHFPPEIQVPKKALEGIKEEKLPVYSILCPLYREERIVEHFLEAIEQIDWPKEKLDVILLLEEEDQETIRKLQSFKLPAYVRIFVVPHSLPKTKPKACNFGLVFAKGEYVVVYDAEDRPDPLQLKKAYLAFQNGGRKLFCLQSKLNYYNPNHNLLTRLFTAEYSLWFDIILQGIQSIEATIPLGGTSNHFRTRDLQNIKGWDPFNVTEDCDLGVRIFKRGFKTAIIDSTTYEEANSSIPNWLRQRSRWIKGYFQTYFVHMRDPIRFLKNHGIHTLLFQLIIGMRMTFMLINPFLWAATLSYFILYNWVGAAIQALYPAPVFYVAVFSLVFGNFMYVYNYMIGCAKRRYWSLVKYVFLIPFYWLMASLASYLALYQLIVKPHYWEKTLHGLHLAPVPTKKPRRAARFAFIPAYGSGIGRTGRLFGRRARRAMRQTSGAMAKAVNGMTLLLKDATNLVTQPMRVTIHIVVEAVSTLPSLFNNHEQPSLDRLKILIFNWRDTKHVWAGGAEVYIHELAKRWVKEGHSVTVFCGNDGKLPRHEVIDGVRIIRRGGFYTVYIWAFIYYITKLRNRFDVVIDSENGVPFFTPLYVRKPKFLLAYHVHQEVFRKHLKAPLSWIARFVESKLMPFGYRDQKVITISNSSKLDLEALGFTSSENIEVVNPGVDDEKYRRLQKTEYPSLVYLGRHKPYKNIDVAIQAFAEILAKSPQAKFIIAGEGESTKDLMKKAENFKLNGQVKFVGKVSEKEKARLFATSWVALQPSSIEGWGLTVIEANASGTPVVASGTNGLRDSILHAETGLLVKPGDASALARAVDWILSYPSKREELSTQAYNWARRFTWEGKADEFLAVIRRELVRREAYRMLGRKIAPDKSKSTLYQSR